MAVSVGKKKPVVMDHESKQVKANIIVTTKDNGIETTDQHEEVLGEVMSDEPLANVGVTAGFTLHTGNFSNIKVSVSLHMPCAVPEIDETYLSVRGWIDERVNALHAEATGDSPAPAPAPAKAQSKSPAKPTHNSDYDDL